MLGVLLHEKFVPKHIGEFPDPSGEYAFRDDKLEGVYSLGWQMFIGLAGFNLPYSKDIAALS